VTKFAISVLHRDRIRTTNNMLGDCYAAAIVEHLSKEQLVAADAAIHQVRKN
jgi:Na+/H+-dicarboxylate symporter